MASRNAFEVRSPRVDLLFVRRALGRPLLQSVHDLKPLYASTKLTYLALPKLCPSSEIEGLKKVAPKVRVTQ